MKEYLKAIDQSELRGMVAWCIDTTDDTIVDITQSACNYVGLTVDQALGMVVWDLPVKNQTIAQSAQKHINALVMQTGIPETITQWAQGPDDKWRKSIVTKTKIDEKHLLMVGHDITHTDSRGFWIQRIDFSAGEKGRIYLTEERDKARSFSRDEYCVLHLYVRGKKYAEMAEILNISKDTVDYRMRRIKDALEVDTVQEVMSRIAVCGMMHLLGLPMDYDPASGLNTAMLFQQLHDRQDGHDGTSGHEHHADD